MSDVMVAVPKDSYQSAQRIANQRSVEVDEVIREHMRLLAGPEVLPDEATELEALQNLSNDGLWDMARARFPKSLDDEMQQLMFKNNMGTISESEVERLNELVERGDRLMLRKAEAVAILTVRGVHVTLEDLRSE